MHPSRNRDGLVPFAIGLVVAFSGCTNETNLVSNLYQDADARFGLAANGGYQDSATFNVPCGASHLAVRATFRANEGLHFTLYDARGSISSNFRFPREVDVRDMTWIEAARPAAGEWRIGVDCGQQCEFAFGFYFEDGLEEVPGIAGKFIGAKKRIVGSSMGGGTKLHPFAVEGTPEHLPMHWSFQAERGFRAVVQDPSGAPRFSLGLPLQSAFHEGAYDVAADPPAGSWGVSVSCDDRCDYAFGFS